jgi:hypothetical protein
MKHIVYVALKAIILFTPFCLADAPKTLNLMIAKDKGLSLRRDFLQAIADTFHVPKMLETGTCYGGTAAIAATVYETVYTVELNPRLYTQACARFKKTPHVHVYKGESPTVLNSLLPTLTGPLVFWLDAHYFGSVKSDFNMPIMEELNAIRNAGITDAIIMIDDACCFQPTKNIKNKFTAEFPSIEEVRTAILTLNPNYVFVVFGDLLLAYPNTHAIEPSAFLQACTTSRMYSYDSTMLEAVLNAERIIATTHDEQSKALNALTSWRNSWMGIYYNLWAGLERLGAHAYDAAHQHFSKALINGLTHWRVYWYQAQTLARMGKKDEALKIIQQVLKNNPELTDAEKQILMSTW